MKKNEGRVMHMKRVIAALLALLLLLAGLSAGAEGYTMQDCHRQTLTETQTKNRNGATVSLWQIDTVQDGVDAELNAISAEADHHGGVRHFLVRTVNGTGAGIYQMLHRMIPTGFQDVEKANQITLDIHIRIGNGVTDTCLGCQIHYHRKAMLLEQLLHQRLVGNVAFDKFPGGCRVLCRLFLDLGKAILLQRYIVIIAYFVQTDNGNRLYSFQQFQYQIGADKTGSTGNQNRFVC